MKLFPLFSLSLTVALAGCSGSGRQTIAGSQCPANYAPINLKVNENQKLWKKGQNETSIPAGTYTYQRSDLIYTEKGDKGAIIHIQDLPDRGGTFKASVACVRNGLNLSAKNISLSVDVASKMIAKAGVATDVEGREISFKVTDKRLVPEGKAIAKPESLEKVYEGKSQDLYMISSLPNKIDYEIRSVFEDNNGKYVVVSKFKRVD